MSDDWLGHHEKSEECDYCSFFTDELEEIRAYARLDGAGPFTPDDKIPWVWLCRVCRGTLVTNSFLYPRNYEGYLQIIGQSMNHNTNLILQAIKERK